MSKSLEELAMDYAILALSMPEVEQAYLFAKTLTVTSETWDAGHLRHQMEVKFGCFATQEAIKQARELLTMVIPANGDDDG